MSDTPEELRRLIASLADQPTDLALKDASQVNQAGALAYVVVRLEDLAARVDTANVQLTRIADALEALAASET